MARTAEQALRALYDVGCVGVSVKSRDGFDRLIDLDLAEYGLLVPSSAKHLSAIVSLTKKGKREAERLWGKP